MPLRVDKILNPFFIWFPTDHLSTPRSTHSPRAKSPLGGVTTTKRVTGRKTEVDVEETKTAKGSHGVVTVRTITEEERTVTKPTHRHTVKSRLMEPTSSSRSHAMKKAKSKPSTPQGRWK